MKATGCPESSCFARFPRRASLSPPCARNGEGVMLVFGNRWRQSRSHLDFITPVLHKPESPASLAQAGTKPPLFSAPLFALHRVCSRAAALQRCSTGLHSSEGPPDERDLAPGMLLRGLGLDCQSCKQGSPSPGIQNPVFQNRDASDQDVFSVV